MQDTSDRHPATQQIVQWFSYDHLDGKPRAISLECADLRPDDARSAARRR